MKLRHCAGALLAASAAAGGIASMGSAQVASAASATIPELTIGSTLTPASIDPTKALNANVVDQLALDTLLKSGPNNRLEPDLASSWSRPNPTTYVYHLRHGVKFWDGNPLTATDVAFSLNYEGRPGNVGAFGRFTDFKSATATNPYTVTVKLTAPNAGWQYTPADAVAGIFEKGYFLKNKATFGGSKGLIMGTGPWKVTSFDPTTGVQFTANPDWWGGKVPVQTLSLKYFSSETSLALAMRAGEVQLDPQVQSQQTFTKTAGSSISVTSSANSCSVGFFAMNVQSAPWNDVHVRRAVAYALDRPDIIKANGGASDPYYTFIPSGQLVGIASPTQVKAMMSSLPLYKHSIVQAKRELAQSAYPHGFSATMLDYSLGNSVADIQVIDAELAQIGIHITPKIVPLASWLANVGGVPVSKRSTTFNLGGCSSPDASGYDAYLGSANLKQGQYNLAAYAPPTVDKWLDEAVAASSPAKRFALYKRVLKQMGSDVPYVPLFTEQYSVAISDKYALPNGTYWPMQTGNYLLGIKSAS